MRETQEHRAESGGGSIWSFALPELLGTHGCTALRNIAWDFRGHLKTVLEIYERTGWVSLEGREGVSAEWG